MKIRKAYKFKLKTNEALEGILFSYAGHCRFLWNYFWRLNDSRLKRGERLISNYYELDFWSKILKRSDEYGFLKEAPAHILQQKLKDLSKAYSDGFDKSQPNKRLPKKRKKALHSTFRFPDPKQVKIENRRLCLPKIGWLGLHKSRGIDGTIKNVSISYHSGDWYVSIQVEQTINQPHIRSLEPIGIDLGIAKFAVGVSPTSTKEWLPVNSFRSLESRIKKEQKKLKHKKKFSNNWKQQVSRVQKLHTKAANIRNHHLHVISTEICKNHARIFVEDLKVKNMSSSAKGSLETPGKNVKAKSGLNKSILDQGWYRFRQFLSYKSQWMGGDLVEINPRYTSQTCSKCGYRDSKNRLSQDSFKCQDCDFETNANVNAAKNILAAGLCRDGLWNESLKRSIAETRRNSQDNTPLFTKQESPCFS